MQHLSDRIQHHVRSLEAAARGARGLRDDDLHAGRTVDQVSRLSEARSDRRASLGRPFRPLADAPTTAQPSLLFSHGASRSHQAPSAASHDTWRNRYDDHRTHQGKMCCGRTPRNTFNDWMRIWKEKLIGDVAT